jgi:O-antigen/teichoic acid export membrane protein
MSPLSFSIMSGSFWSLVQNGTRMAVSLVSVPLAVTYLGNERYGLWMAVLSITSFVTFFDLGLIPTLLNRMAGSFASGNLQQFKTYSSASLFCGLCIFIIGSILSALSYLMDWAAILSLKNPWLQHGVSPLVSWLMFLSFGSLALSVVDSIYAARMQFVKPKLYATVASVAGLGMLFAGIYWEVSLTVLAAINIGPLLLYRIVLLVEIFLTERSLIIPQAKQLPGLFKELLPVSVLFMLIQLFSVAFSSAPNLFLAKYAGLEEVTSFSVCYRLYNVPLFMLSGVLSVFWPAFTIAWEKRDLPKLRRWLIRACVVTFAILMGYLLIVCIGGSRLIELWTRGNVHPSTNLLILMGVWMVVQGIVHWLSTFLHSITDFRFEIVSYGFSALILTTLAWWSAQRFGGWGVAASMGFALTVGALIPMTKRCSEKLSRWEST